MFTFKQFLRYVMKVVSKRKRKQNPLDLIPRVRVLDNEINRANAHWRALIGEEGVFLGRRVDEDGEIWDVKLDSQPIPHSMIMKERFEVISGRVNAG